MATLDIELYYDLDRRRWTTSAGGLATQPSLFIGQSNTIDFKVRFVQGGVPIELTNPSFIAGLKVTDDPLGNYLLLTTTGTKIGTGAATIYTFTLLIDSVELQAYLVGITPSTNSTAFEVRDTVNNIATLPAITCSILPDYTLTGATPAAGSGTLVVDSGATFTVHKSFAMPVDDGTDTYVLKTNGAGVGRWAVDSAGTGTVTNVAVTTANGVSGSVANPTASAAITIALGAITPISASFSGTDEATNIASGSINTQGGMGVTKSLYVGKRIEVGDGSSSSSFNGGISIVGDVSVSEDLIATSLKSTAGNQTLLLLPVASSVNYVTIEPSVAGLPPHIYAKGADTDIGLHLSPKGTGYVNVQDGNDPSKRLRFSASGNTTEMITTLASSSTSSQTITLPNATGATTLAGLQMVQTFTAANTFSLTTDATSSSAGAVMISGGLAVAKKLYVGTTLFLSNGHRVTFFTSTTTTSQPTLYGVDGGGGQGQITFGSFGADGTTALYGGINGAPASINCYKAELNCSYIALAPSGGLKDSGGNIALTVTSNKAIAMGGTLAVTGTTTCTGGVIIGSGQALKLGNAATTGLTAGVLSALTNASITITDSAGTVYRIPCIV